MVIEVVGNITQMCDPSHLPPARGMGLAIVFVDHVVVVVLTWAYRR